MEGGRLQQEPRKSSSCILTRNLPFHLDVLQQDPINIPGISPLGALFPLGHTQEYDTTRLVDFLKFLPPLSLQVQDAQDGDDGNCKKVAIGKENYPCCSQVLF